MIPGGPDALCGGDEIGRTQQGNDNAYCQDNEISWFDWTLDARARRALAFTRRLIRFRHAHPELRRRKLFQGRPLCSADRKDLTWHRPDGSEMAAAEWLQAIRRERYRRHDAVQHLARLSALARDRIETTSPESLPSDGPQACAEWGPAVELWAAGALAAV